MSSALFDLKSLNDSLKSEIESLQLLQHSTSRSQLSQQEVASLIATRAIRASILLKNYQTMFKVNNPQFANLTDYIYQSHSNILENLNGKTALNLNTLMFNLQKNIQLAIQILTKYFHGKLNTCRKTNLMIRYLDDLQNTVQFCRQCLSSPLGYGKAL